ncbi:restriction endonuclease subunit S [Cyanobium sp. Morenito 9A2]|uniref:restriction endonuclease subunit S n=1 Tax=Cyanobium sp. Morenito 9A2 TaxID=2823718 RepID=UPI0020CF4E2C|nr:restriction endonuclease subunit S [Cyanobium sp. Morenito 9A2]MCP9848409.1 restriction endonuclease subunit S [Cyanobium sp. Morenito 9A2]
MSAYPSISMPLHWAEAAFDDLFRNVTSSSRKLPAGSYLTSGTFPVIDQGERYIGGFTNDAGLVHEGALPAIVFGDHTRCIKYVSRPFVQGADGVKVLCPSTSINPRFCYWALIQADIPSKGYARHFAILRALRLPLAPLREQNRIVEAIESCLTRLDDAMATLERVQRNLKRYRASVLKAAVEGRLVPTEAELARAEGREYEPASVLLERIRAERRRRWEEAELAKLKAKGKVPKNDTWKAKYVEPAGPDTSELPELPEGWCWSSLGELFDIRVGATPSRAKPEFWNGGIPWVSSSEVSFCRITCTRETISEEGLRHSSTQLNPPGSVLLGMIGEGKTRGQAAILNIPACNNQNSAAIWVSTSGLPPEYVYYFLVGEYEVTRGRGSGNNQPALNKSRVQAIPIPLPPLAESHRIVREIDRHESVINSLEESSQLSHARCIRLRQSILKWAFEGRLVDQDPSDEPAQVLLERIRAKSAAGNGRKQPRPRRVNTRTANA